MHHEPGSLLSDTDIAGDLIRTDSVLGIDHHPHGAHPLIERDRTVLKYSSHFDAVLFLTALAGPQGAGLDESMFQRLTARTHRTIRPA